MFVLHSVGPSRALGQQRPGRRLDDIHTVVSFHDGSWDWCAGSLRATALPATALPGWAASDEQKFWLRMASPRQAPPDEVLTMAARISRLEAILSLRRLLELNPENAGARDLLQRREEQRWRITR